MKKISELTLTELTKRESQLKGILLGYGILGLAIFFLMLYLRAEPILFIPVCVLPITGFPLLITLKSLKDEIAKRKADSNGII